MWLKNCSGFTALETMVAISISGIILLGTSTIIAGSIRSGARSERLFWLEARRLQLQSLVNSADGWKEINLLNADLQCVNKLEGCKAYTTSQPMKIPIDGIILDGASPKVGMNPKGEFCNTFDPVNGNALCPIGLKLNWHIMCDDAKCMHGEPQINIKFISKDPTGAVNENLAVFDLNIYKNPQLESLNEVCTAMNGKLTNSTTCTIQQLSSACDPAAGSFVVGFDDNGFPQCGRPNPGGCAGKDVATGFDSAGGVQCAVACP